MERSGKLCSKRVILLTIIPLILTVLLTPEANGSQSFHLKQINARCEIVVSSPPELYYYTPFKLSRCYFLLKNIPSSCPYC